MDIRSQNYMIALAESGSLLNAAKALGISQPAISAWLTNLENELDVQLVIRGRNGIVLTPAGRLYLEGSRKMAEEKNRFYQEAKMISAMREDIIRIGGTPMGGARTFAAYYKYFKTVMPAVTLQFTECYNKEMLELIRKGRIDFGIGSVADPVSEDIEFQVTGCREHVLMIPEGYPGYYDPSSLRKDTEFPVIDLSRVRDLPFIMPSAQVSFHDALCDIFRQADYTPAVVFRSSNTGALYSMMREGNGIGVISRSSFSPLDRVAPYSFSPPFLIYGVLAYKKGKVLTPAETELVRFEQRRHA